MSQTIKLESIKRLDIRAGETLAVTLPEGADVEYAQRVHRQLSDALPNVNIIVTSYGVDLQVLCPSSPA